VAELGTLRKILASTEPVEHPRRGRLPLLVWTLTDLPGVSASEREEALREMEARGMALISSWDHAAPHETPGSAEAALAVARAQSEIGLDVVVNANALLHRFCDGSRLTAHVDDGGRPFFDTSFDPSVRMGCPFALEHREPEIRSRVLVFADAYAAAGLRPTFVFADWEIDGAMEWNGAWEASRRCRRCRAEIPDIDDFAEFQLAVRRVRSHLQRATFAEPLTSRFPGLLVGNYGVYPHGGVRGWYDYFERLPPGLPASARPGAGLRIWAHEYPWTGYTAALPVIYPWCRSYDWSEPGPPDFRWAYTMLREASIAGRHTPRGTPLVPFVHWRPISEDGAPRPDVVPLDQEGYREILWHQLLRGASTLFLWCPAAETATELPPVHAVYRESLRYADLLAGGEPLLFDVPRRPGPLVSGVTDGSRILLRRTDFGGAQAGEIEVDCGSAGRLRVESAPGKCILRRVRRGAG
jgi:hypothetical protein